ncbi:MAG: YkgJ family cysteine cluster protein [Oscillatoriales cyanobacterium SM2_2_1]|nr:YkgJ family cysteine cluster protein [Oscillatoriales cyanobacterium SM2_2_1]
MATWQCMEQCGACCHLAPQDRPDLATYLTVAELNQYLQMVGTDGWCVHFEPLTRRCGIYNHRPEFCRVTADTFHRLFGISAEELNDFAIDCCREQIGAVYGENSLEGRRYERAIAPR